MESVLKSIGGLDDALALRAATGATLRRLSQSVSDSAAQIPRSTKTYNLAEARAAAQSAVAGAAEILNKLDDIRSQLSVADGIRTPSLRGDGTRSSVQGEIIYLLGQIDAVVAQSSASGLNLLAQPAELTTVRTTRYGGTVTLAGQPLDINSLGIQSLDVSDQSAVEQAIAKVDRARELASLRYDQLASASRGLRADTAFDDSLLSAVKALSGKSTPSPGAVVNLRS